MPKNSRTLDMCFDNISRTILSAVVERGYQISTNSGAEVPDTTTVGPITIFGIPNNFCRDDAPSTSLPAPELTRTNPDRRQYPIIWFLSLLN